MLIGKLEKKILELIDNEVIDIEKVRELFVMGANPNALESLECEIIEDYEYWSTFFSECIFTALDKYPDLYPLLELFIEYGLDVDKYGPSIISDFHFIAENNDLIEMTKLILNHMTKGNNISQSLDGIGAEASFLNSGFENEDERSNYFDTIYDILNFYEKDKDYTKIYDFHKIIGQKVNFINIFGNIIKTTDNKLIAKFGKIDESLITLLKCSKDTLKVLDEYKVYVDNNVFNNLNDNDFIKLLKRELVGETITKIGFEHKVYQEEIKLFSYRYVVIYFSNNKKIKYKFIHKENIIEIEFEK